MFHIRANLCCNALRKRLEILADSLCKESVSNKDMSQVNQTKHTNLSPHHLRQSTDKLRRRINAQLDSLLIDDLANRQPQRGFQALYQKLATHSHHT